MLRLRSIHTLLFTLAPFVFLASATAQAPTTGGDVLFSTDLPDSVLRGDWWDLEKIQVFQEQSGQLDPERCRGVFPGLLRTQPDRFGDELQLPGLLPRSGEHGLQRWGLQLDERADGFVWSVSDEKAARMSDAAPEPIEAGHWRIAGERRAADRQPLAVH